MIITRPPELNTATKELLKEAPEGNPPSQRFSSACCSAIFSILETSHSDTRLEGRAASEKEVKFDEYATRFTYMQAVDKVKSPPTSPTGWFISPEHVIDEFHPKGEEEFLTLGIDPKMIEGKWVISFDEELTPLAACYAMLLMDANGPESIPSFKEMSDTVGGICSEETFLERLQATALLMELDGVAINCFERSKHSNEKMLRSLLAKSSQDSWSAVIATLETASGLHPVILDEYDPSMGILFIRDPSKGKSFSMHIDDFLSYNPSKRFIRAKKGLSIDELKDVQQVISDKARATQVHRSVKSLSERVFSLWL